MKSSGQNTETRSGYLVFLGLSWGYGFWYGHPHYHIATCDPCISNDEETREKKLCMARYSQTIDTVAMLWNRHIDRSINDKFPLIQLLAIFSNPMSTLSISCVFVLVREWEWRGGWWARSDVGKGMFVRRSAFPLSAYFRVLLTVLFIANK